MLAAVTLCMMAGTGLRSSFGVYIKPMEAEFGWGRGALSGVAAVSLLILGAVGPFVGRLADRWGPRRVVIVSLLLLGVGALGACRASGLAQIYLTIGLLMAVGAGGLSIATGSTVAARRIELTVSDAARALLGREGYDPSFGARPLKRTIQRLVQDPLSLKLLQREFVDGDAVTADAEGDAIVFKRTAPASTGS